METPANTPVEQSIVPTMKTPLILMEILSYGTTEDKPKIKKMFARIQAQLAKSKVNKSKARLLWYIDNGEKTEEEKKEWLINEANSVFYVFAPLSYKVPDNYISNLMIGPNMFDRAMKLLRSEGIKMKGKKRGEQVEEIISEPNEIME